MEAVLLFMEAVLLFMEAVLAGRTEHRCGTEIAYGATAAHTLRAVLTPYPASTTTAYHHTLRA
eukprot:1028875-Rhodomonas_salina.1